MRNDLESISWEVRGSFTREADSRGKEGAKAPRGKWASEAWRRPMQQALVRACLRKGSAGRVGAEGGEREGRTPV